MFAGHAIKRGISAVAALAVLMSMATSPIRPSYYAQQIMGVFQFSGSFAAGANHSHAPAAKSPTMRSMVVKAVRLEQKNKSIRDRVCPTSQSFLLPVRSSFPLDHPSVVLTRSPVSVPIRC
jgi:hypothetical protein